MIQVLNTILYYLNLAALLQESADLNGNNTVSPLFYNGSEEFSESNVALLVKQIPPGPIIPGVIVKFVCVSIPADEANGNAENCKNEPQVFYQWEMHQYTEDQNGQMNNGSVFRLPGQHAEMEMEFNESVTNPKTHCDLRCSVNNPRPSSGSIKLHFLNKNSQPTLQPPLSFTILGYTSRTAYFSWKPPNVVSVEVDGKHNNFKVTGFVIEYKSGRRLADWKNGNVSRRVIGDGDTLATCVSDLSPGTPYHFRIYAVSYNTSSAPTLSISILTLEDLPSASPTDVRVTVQNQSALHVSWKPPPRHAWNGALLGYNVGYRRVSSAEEEEEEPYEIIMVSPLERLVLGNPYSYRITVPDTSIKYQVVVQAFNNIGSGPFSAPVVQNTET